MHFMQRLYWAGTTELYNRANADGSGKMTGTVWFNKITGRLLYAYGMLWAWPFRLTPARWVCAGCSGWGTLRGRWGAFVACQYGWVRNGRYETMCSPMNDEFRGGCKPSSGTSCSQEDKV